MIAQVPWSQEASDGLSRALPNAVIRSIVEAEVIRGQSQLWECKDETHKAFVVTRVDANPVELVVVAFEGSGMQHFGKYFIDAANARGIPLRAHVTNPIVERLLRRLGVKREYGEVIVRTRAAA